MTLGRAIAGVVASVVVIAFIAFLSTTSARRESVKSLDLRTQAIQATARASGSDNIVLPPADMPLREAIESLRAAAARGNNLAACRLAMELLRCKQYTQDREALEQLKQTPAQLLANPQWRKLFAAAVAEVRARVSADNALCKDAPQDNGQAWRLLLDAGMRGHVPSMARFGSGAAIRNAKARGEWDMDAIGAYREYGFPFLERAALEGDAASIERLGTEYMTTTSGSRTMPHDPTRGLAYLKALAARSSPEYRKHIETKISELTQQTHMTAAEISAAEAVASTILPPRSLARLTNQELPDFSAHNDFGCR